MEAKPTATHAALITGKRAHNVAVALGKARREGSGWRCVCPVHGGCSLVVRDGRDALLVKCWGGGCATEDVLAELRARGLLDDQAPTQRASRTPVEPTSNDNDAHLRRQHEKAAWLWSQRQPIGGTIAERYLREARGITCPLPPTLGFLPPRKPEHHPAMIAAFALPDEMEPGVLAEPRVEAVHLTLLRADGSGKAETPDGKSNKIIVGSSRLPIVLAPPNDLLGLSITEGIEDGLSVLEATGCGVWVAGCASRMPKLAAAIPSWVECTTIWADDDAAGRKSAYSLAELLDQRDDMEIKVEGLP